MCGEGGGGAGCMWRGVGFIIVIPTNELTKGERERQSMCEYGPIDILKAWTLFLSSTALKNLLH